MTITSTKDGNGIYYIPVTTNADTTYITYDEIYRVGGDIVYNVDDMIMTDYLDTSGHYPVTGRAVYNVSGQNKNSYNVTFLYLIKDGITPSVTVNSDASVTFTIGEEEVTTPSLKGEPGEPGEPGNAGADATAYKMLVNALAIGKTASGTYKQSTITVQGRKQTGGGAYSSYACRFKIETTTSSNLSSATWTSRYTSSSNVSSYTYTILSGITGIRVSMYLAGGTTTLLDQVIIPIVTDGADGADGEDGADASLTPTLLASAKTLSSGSSFSVSSVKDLLLLEIANSSERSRKMEVFIKGVSATRYIHIPYDESTELFMTVSVTWSGSTATIKCTKFSAIGNWSSGTSQLCYAYTL